MAEGEEAANAETTKDNPELPKLTRRRSTDAREECWHVYYGDMPPRSHPPTGRDRAEGEMKPWVFRRQTV